MCFLDWSLCLRDSFWKSFGAMALLFDAVVNKVHWCSSEVNKRSRCCYELYYGSGHEYLLVN